MMVWRLYIVIQVVVASSKFFAFRESNSSLYSLFVKNCQSCDCYTSVEDPKVNIKLGNFTKDWYTDSHISLRDSKSIGPEWQCTIDGTVRYRNSISNNDSVWYDITKGINVNLINQKLDPCKGYIDIELALETGQQRQAFGNPNQCIIEALRDEDQIEDDDYLFISSSRNGSQYPAQYHCSHQLFSRNSSILLKVSKGAKLNIYNEKCIKNSVENMTNLDTNTEVRNDENYDEYNIEQLDKNVTENKSSPYKKFDWVLFGPICVSLVLVIFSLTILTICCWKKKKETRNKRHTWDEIYFNIESSSAMSSIRSRMDPKSSLKSQNPASYDSDIITAIDNTKHIENTCELLSN